MVFDQVRKANGNFDRHPSYVGVVKQKMMFQQTRDDENKPSIVLDDSCVLQCDYSLSLTGKVLDFGSLSNLKMIIVNGKVFWIRAKEVCGWVPDFLEDEEEGDESDEDTFDDEFGKDNSKVNMNFNSEGESDKEEVQETIFSSHKVESKGRDDINDDDDVLISDDPFKIYDLLEKQKLQEEKSNKGMSSSKEEDKESRCSGHFRRVEGPKTGGSILQLLDDVVKVGQTMGYKMDGCVSNIEEIIKSRGENDPSVGNSGGILCVWDPRMFRKQNSTVSDYFVAIQGVWIPNAKKCLIISVYAPQEVSEKKMLWSYLNHVIDNWSGETIIMGDFNEVRRIGGSSVRGCAFTWCHKSGNKMSKLDRFLISEGLMGMCPNISAITLDRYLSDHRPILLREVCHDYGPIPFRVFHYWFEWEGFDELVKDTWSKSTITDNNAISKFMKKLKFLKEQIRLFVRAKKESACMQRLNLKGMLTEIDLLIDEKKVDQVLLNKRSQVMNSLHDFGKLESMEIAQKAKIKWSIEGDENSKYFHGILNKKRNQTAIRGILAEGVWIDDPNSVKNEFLSHFKERFDRPCSSRLILDMTYPNRLNLDQIDDLERNVTKEEIKRAVWDCGTDKSPGPDGFTFGFYRRYWDIMEKDVVDAVSFFFTEEKFGFGSKWRGWIHNCLHSSKGSILVNGSPTDEFHFRRGLKQGDPLSPFLFILVMESLHLSFQNVVDEGLFKGVSVGSSLQLSHLFYADDVIFMGQWSESNIITIVHALDCFHKASGLRMNLQKSKLLGIAVEDEKVSRAAMKMGCCTLKTLFYRGYKSGGMMTRIKSWDEIVAKLHSRLSKWKLKTFSIGGRLTLLKSVLGSTPIYYMNSLWTRFIKALYGNSGSIETPSKVAYSSTWLNIVIEFSMLKNQVYALESDKKITVADKMNHNVLGFSLRRAPRDGVEMEQFRDMIAILEGVELPAMHDTDLVIVAR
ncbi:RNA-directed DNA polymerase, eukaryota [Tanacetum coccineum]|uniref:RNA-directed DNA polymerase, eukaryota n=1 Tax=Tanacetum coccineum TaxID=301880 RepID=A0ABQ5FQG9_9ASTR